MASDPKRGEVFYSLVEIERIWFGNCILFYPMPLKGKVPTLKEGVKNPMTRRLQEQLTSLGYYKGDVTGEFNTTTKNSVLHFQRDFALQPDGVVGRITKAIMFQITGKSLYGDSR